MSSNILSRYSQYLTQNRQLQTAKARFREPFRRARSEGRQLINCGDQEGVVMVSDEQYQQLAKAPAKKPFAVLPGIAARRHRTGAGQG